MDPETTVDAGSETSGAEAVVETSEDTTTAETTETPTEQSVEVAADAGGAAETDAGQEPVMQAGDPCTCPDGRAGTLWNDGATGFACLPNQG
jgi:hypothetical protein